MIGQNGILLSRYWKWAYPTGALYSPEEVDLMVADGYIPVANAAELDALRNTTMQTMGAGTKWRGQYTTGVDKKYVVVNNIDLSGFDNFLGISAFSGILDGNLLNFDYLKQNRSFPGFFSYAFTGECLNIKFRNADVKDDDSVTASRTGIVVGYTEAGAYLHNISIDNSELFGTNDAGFICGYMAGDGTVIENCSVVNSVIKSSDYRFVGGITGVNTSVGALSIKNCRVVNCELELSNISIQAGGIAGANSVGNTIENCYSTMLINNTSKAGGICGSNSGVIVNSYWDTQTSGQATSAGGTGKTTSELKNGLLDDPDTDGNYVGWPLDKWTKIYGEYIKLAWEN